MRLDRFLARWFRNWSRSELARGIKRGEVRSPDGRSLRASHTVRSGESIEVWIPRLAASGPPPPFPQILHEDERVVVVNKPAGLMCHPAGDRFVYALIGLAKDRWPEHHVDLVHRIDADTSGLVAITKDRDANAALKASFRRDDTVKEYEAIARGWPDWERRTLDGAIGPAGGEVRIQMAVVPDGLPSTTHATVLGRTESPIGPLCRVRCRIETGRTHQIRVHLSDAGHSLIGDRLYGERASLFLDIREDGFTLPLRAEAGAPRHALHSASLRVPHPDGGWLEVESALPEDMQRWWDTPEVLPLDGFDQA